MSDLFYHGFFSIPIGHPDLGGCHKCQIDAGIFAQREDGWWECSSSKRCEYNIAHREWENLTFWKRWTTAEPELKKLTTREN